ncbi:MAG: hydroxymethylglutaryl-CoA reductase (NADPH) [Candidatus Syntropharchaeia archaeon]
MNDEEIIEGIKSGRIKFREVENYTDNDSLRATELRRRALEEITGTSLKNIGNFSIDANAAMRANIENMIGAVQIPCGVAGPINVHGEYANGEYYVPMATTEGALIASVSRGCLAINLSGGARSYIIRDGMARAPVLRAPDASHARKVANYIKNNFEEVKRIADESDPFISLSRIDPYIVGRNLFLRFVYNTGDAMGMNMATIATDETLKFLEEKFPFLTHIALSGNMCVDKKPSAINFIEGRGKSVISEVILKKEVIKDVLKTDPHKMEEICYRKCLIGSAQAGSYGFNSHFANMIGAIFLACGQDEAHIVESSNGFTTAEITEDGDLYFSVTIPSLCIGTIGGGTGVDTQREALSIMGIYGPGNPPGSNSRKFAEIIGGIVLAGEVSLIGALGARHLAESHIRLNR